MRIYLYLESNFWIVNFKCLNLSILSRWFCRRLSVIFIDIILKRPKCMPVSSSKFDRSYLMLKMWKVNFKNQIDERLSGLIVRIKCWSVWWPTGGWIGSYCLVTDWWIEKPGLVEVWAICQRWTDAGLPFPLQLRTETSGTSEMNRDISFCICGRSDSW